MATLYSNFAATKKPFSLILVTLTTMFLLIHSTKALSFNFTRFTSRENLILQGSAEILTNGILSLTGYEEDTSLGNIGRALYSDPVTIWDETTGKVASFVTSFSFVAKDFECYTPADGLVFFLAPTDTKIPDNSAAGNLGVVDAKRNLNQFVGVEFDSYPNEWDPKTPHIGIDANSLISLKTVEWKRVSGSLVKVIIIYDALSKTLSVAVTNNDCSISTVAQVVDLKAVLPSKVRLGLSAATSKGGLETHDIYSWTFTSTLEIITPPSPPPEPCNNLGNINIEAKISSCGCNKRRGGSQRNVQGGCGLVQPYCQA